MKYTVALALFATVAAYDNVILADGDDKKDDNKKEEKKPAAYCALTSWKMYSDKDCTKDEVVLDAAKLKALNEKSAVTKDCVKSGDDPSLKVTCDAASKKTTVYKDDKCTAGQEDKATSTEVKWTECSKLADGQFVKATGAKALLAGAAAALAFVGSQFS